MSCHRCLIKTNLHFFLHNLAATLRLVITIHHYISDSLIYYDYDWYTYTHCAIQTTHFCSYFAFLSNCSCEEPIEALLSHWITRGLNFTRTSDFKMLMPLRDDPQDQIVFFLTLFKQGGEGSNPWLKKFVADFASIWMLFGDIILNIIRNINVPK